MTSREFQDLRQPCVYVLWRDDILGDEVLYVGATAHGYSRLFVKNTGADGPNRGLAFDHCTRVTVEFFSSRNEALEEEKQLIHTHHPKYNCRCVLCDGQWNKSTVTGKPMWYYKP